MKHNKELLLDILSSAVTALVSIVTVSVLTQVVMINFVDKLVFQMIFRLSIQASYNLIVFCAMVGLVLSYQFVLRFRRFEVQDALKEGETVGEIVKKRFWRQNLVFLTVFVVCAFIPAWSGVRETFKVVERSGLGASFVVAS